MLHITNLNFYLIQIITLNSENRSQCTLCTIWQVLTLKIVNSANFSNIFPWRNDFSFARNTLVILFGRLLVHIETKSTQKSETICTVLQETANVIFLLSSKSNNCREKYLLCSPIRNSNYTHSLTTIP